MRAPPPPPPPPPPRRPPPAPPRTRTSNHHPHHHHHTSSCRWRGRWAGAQHGLGGPARRAVLVPARGGGDGEGGGPAHLLAVRLAIAPRVRLAARPRGGRRRAALRRADARRRRRLRLLHAVRYRQGGDRCAAREGARPHAPGDTPHPPHPPQVEVQLERDYEFMGSKDGDGRLDEKLHCNLNTHPSACETLGGCSRGVVGNGATNLRASA